MNKLILAILAFLAIVAASSIVVVTSILSPKPAICIESIEFYDFGTHEEYNLNSSEPFYYCMNITFYFRTKGHTINVYVEASTKDSNPLEEHNFGCGSYKLIEPCGFYELTFHGFFFKEHTYDLTIHAFKTFYKTITVK